MSCLLMGPNAKLRSSLLHHEHVVAGRAEGEEGGGMEGARIGKTFHLLLFKTIVEADKTEPVRTDGFLSQYSEEVKEAKRNQIVSPCLGYLRLPVRNSFAQLKWSRVR